MSTSFLTKYLAPFRAQWLTLSLAVLILVGLFWIGQVNYLLFHVLSELFSIVIAFTIFVMTWNSRRLITNGYLLILGMSFLFTASFDLLHMLTYKGMNIFPGTAYNEVNASNLTTQLWCVARFLLSGSLVLAPFCLQRKVKIGLVLLGYAFVSVLFFLSLFVWNNFPASFLDNGGMTPFKRGAEYVIIILFTIGMVLLLRIRTAFDENVLQLLVFSIAVNIAAEFAFTEYLSVSDGINMFGHFLKIVAYFLIYKAIVEIGFSKPHELLFRELAQNEQALRASEALARARAVQLETIMNVVPAVVWISHDAHSRKVTGNHASAELLHLPPNANHSRFDPAVSQHFRFYDKQGNELPIEKLPLHVAASQGIRVSDYEETFVYEDGTLHNLYGNVAPLLDENGKPAGAVAAFIDITERVQAEKALQESEVRYRTLFNTMAEGFALQEVLYNDQGQPVDYRFIEVNPAFERIIGLSRKELVGKTILQVMPEAVSPWIEHYASVIESGASAHFEDFSFLANRYLEMMVNPVRGNTCAAFVIDVTERRRSQEALRQSESRLRRLVDANIIGIVTANIDGELYSVNDAFLRMIGYSRAEYEAGLLNWRALTPAEDLPKDEQGVREAEEQGACTPYEKEYIRKDGSRIPVLIGYAFLEGSDSTYICYIVDLTQQKRAEDSAREYADQLEKINKELERANRELQDFAFVASHDLQEPLRKIQAFGERLNNRLPENLEEETRDYLERMLNAAMRMRAMINDLLALSRVTTRGQPFEWVDLKAVAEEVVSDLEVRIERSGGQVTLGDLPTLEADPIQMHQLLQNLIGNALKFHKPDIIPQVNVYSEPAADGEHVIIYVNDNGIGFEEQYLERIFQPFQRLHGMGQYEGSGMGLAICRKIVERHAGTITAHSALGEGTTFIVTLPVLLPAPQPEQSMG